MGIEANLYYEANNDIAECISEIENMLKGLEDTTISSTKDLYAELITRCENSLKRNAKKRERIRKATAIGILYNISGRLDNWRVKDRPKNFPIQGMDVKTAVKMNQDIKTLLSHYLKI